MIKIHSIAFSNVFSYGANNLVTTDNAAVTQILGKNGSGKSSIALVLEEGLYHKNSKGVKKGDIRNRNTDDPYTICIKFSVGNDIYELNKVVKSTAKVTLTKNGEDVSGHTATQTYAMLQDEILKLDFNTFSKLVYQSTQSSLDFLTATDTNRKKFLVSLLGLEYLAEIESIFKEAKKEADKNVASITGSLKTLTDWVNDNGKIAAKKKEVEVPDGPSEDMENRAAELRNAKLQATSINTRVATQVTNLQKLKEAEKNTPAPCHDVSEELKIVTHDVTSVQALKTKIKQEHTAFKSKAIDVCPTCGQSVDSSDVKKALAKLAAEFAELKDKEQALLDKKTELTAQNTKYTEYNKALAKMEAAKALVDYNFSEQYVDIEQTTEELNALTAQIKAMQTAVTTAIAENAKVATHNAKCDEDALKLEHTNLKLQELSASLDEASELVNNLDIITKAFGNKGLVAYKIESMLKVFESILNGYLSELSYGRFVLMFEVEGEKLNVSLLDNGDTVDIKSLSSGELNRVNTATLLAVRKLMSAASKTHINLLILDEIVSVLDDDGFSALVDILFKESNLNSFVVSHGRSADPRVARLQVVKHGNKSSISD